MWSQADSPGRAGGIRGLAWLALSDGEHDGNQLLADMGFATAAGGPMPGVSAFQMKGGQVVHRVHASPFDDFDEFCLAWRLFDLLPEGANGWRPQRNYETA